MSATLDFNSVTNYYEASEMPIHKQWAFSVLHTLSYEIDRVSNSRNHQDRFAKVVMMKMFWLLSRLDEQESNDVMMSHFKTPMVPTSVFVLESDLWLLLEELEAFEYNREADHIDPYNIDQSIYNDGRFKTEQALVYGIDGHTDELVSTNQWKHFKFPFQHFNPMQSVVIQHIEHGVNLVVSSPTASGKTQIAELAISYALHKDEKAIYLSPMKALSEEKLADFGNKSHPFSKSNIAIMTGDYQLTKKQKETLYKNDIFIMTNEMLDTRTRMANDEGSHWFSDVGVLVVDESHLITLPGRGDSTETAIMRFADINPNAQIILLSATMRNSTELSRWLTVLNNKLTVCVDSTYRPVKLNVNMVPIERTGYYYTQESVRADATVGLIMAHPDDKFLVFTGNKSWGRMLVSKLEELGIESMFHNADLTRDKRAKVGSSFKKRRGGMRVMVSTSTTAWGVNLPARRVVVAHTGFGQSPMPACDVQQMVGRAGRPKYDSDGDAYILIPGGDKKEYDRVTKPQVIESRLAQRDVLEFHVVAEVYRDTIKDESTFYGWLERTLAFNQAKTRDTNYEELFGSLKSYGVIYQDNDIWKVTSLGKIAVWMYFSPRAVAMWRRNLVWFKRYIEGDGVPGDPSGVMNLRLNGGLEQVKCKDVVFSWMLVYQALDKPYVLAREREDVSMFAASCRSSLSYMYLNRMTHSFDADGYAKLSLVSALQLAGVNSDDYSVAARQLVYESDRYMQAISMINKMVVFGGESIEKELDSYSIRLKYGVPEELIELVSLPGIGRARAYNLYDQGIQTARDLEVMAPLSMAILGEGAYNRAMEAIRNEPILD